MTSASETLFVQPCLFCCHPSCSDHVCKVWSTCAHVTCTYRPTVYVKEEEEEEERKCVFVYV